MMILEATKGLSRLTLEISKVKNNSQNVIFLRNGFYSLIGMYRIKLKSNHWLNCCFVKAACIGLCHLLRKI